MPKRTFSQEQITGILKEHEAGAPVAALCQKYAVSRSSIYKWEVKHGGAGIGKPQHMKALEEENSRLKQLLAEVMLDNSALKDLLRKQ